MSKPPDINIIKDSYRIVTDTKLCCTCHHFYHDGGGYEGCDGFECTYKNCFIKVELNGVCNHWEKER